MLRIFVIAGFGPGRRLSLGGLGCMRVDFCFSMLRASENTIL